MSQIHSDMRLTVPRTLLPYDPATLALARCTRAAPFRAPTYLVGIHEGCRRDLADTSLVTRATGFFVGHNETLGKSIESVLAVPG
jgi:hypothetical protein